MTSVCAVRVRVYIMAARQRRRCVRPILHAQRLATVVCVRSDFGCYRLFTPVPYCVGRSVGRQLASRCCKLHSIRCVCVGLYGMPPPDCTHIISHAHSHLAHKRESFPNVCDTHYITRIYMFYYHLSIMSSYAKLVSYSFHSFFAATAAAVGRCLAGDFGRLAGVIRPSLELETKEVWRLACVCVCVCACLCVRVSDRAIARDRMTFNDYMCARMLCT